MNCLACGGQITVHNVSSANNEFHRVCMDDGVGIRLSAKYTSTELEYTWAGLFRSWPATLRALGAPAVCAWCNQPHRQCWCALEGKENAKPSTTVERS